jgi:hypothetical protein
LDRPISECLSNEDAEIKRGWPVGGPQIRASKRELQPSKRGFRSQSPDWLTGQSVLNRSKCSRAFQN